VSKPEQPSAFHIAQRALWKAQLRADYMLTDAKHEIEIMEYRERRDDPQAWAEAEDLIRRVKG
jgi:hypothetical protein